MNVRNNYVLKAPVCRLTSTTTYTTTDLLIFLSYLKSSNVLLNLDLLNTLLLIISLIPTNLLTLSTTPLKRTLRPFNVFILLNDWVCLCVIDQAGF